MTTIRNALAADADALYEVCLRTAAGGDDGTDKFDDPLLPGAIFSVPYPIFEPSLAFVAEDEQGVGGYIVGARDTLEFGAVLEREWWPKLREQYPLGVSRGADDQRMVEHIHNPPAPPEVAYPDYPSHLHINLLPRMQGQGLGRKLMDVLFAELRAQGSPGVHLNVWAHNERAVAFYRHLGLGQLHDNGTGFTMGARF
ncbi:GNAT family N-acetyltransferase [Kibdelosporangium lantanae]|uniref:GNAT family N-acetyltransferase n=1 Tax=Kibdelosporangium lantanae TaxID=1497396 RepID=A0ABW3MC13_9PSEU